MNVFTLEIKKIVPSNIYFLDAKQNMIMNGTFSKLIYTNDCFTMNGIYTYVSVDVIIPDNYYNKQIVQFSPINQINQYFLNSLEYLEKLILEMYRKLNPNNKKTAIHSLYHQLQLGQFKIFKEFKTMNMESQYQLHPHLSNYLNNSPIEKKTQVKNFVLKISGIWETANEFGITYKFMESNGSVSFPLPPNLSISKNINDIKNTVNTDNVSQIRILKRPIYTTN